MIGATTSQTLDLTLINNGDIVYGTSTIKVEIGLKIGSTIEYIPIGIYNIDDIEKNDYTIKITAFDNMIKFEKNFTTTLGDNLTLQQIVSELTRITGIQFTGSLPYYTVKKLEGFTCREVLGYVASICGGNAVITRDGKFTIITPKDISYSIGTNNYFDYKREETKYKIGKISCQVGEEILSKGSLGTDSMELEFENPWVNATILTDIYNKLNGFEYLGYSMKWQGDLSLDVGDIITVTDKKGVVRKHPILSQKFTYTGGLTSELEAKGENKNKNSYSSSGPSTNKVDRIVTELAIVNKALIDVAYIGDLTAGNIKFDTASGGILDLQTLLAKHITGENGQFLNITSSNTVIANAVIKDAMIENISVDKLLAGRISTNKINISSDDGGITIVGPTMQFKDKNNKVRIQMGQDTQGSFNFILRGEDGTTTLIDHTGIKEKAIADDLIKSNMVAADAIGEKQINYSSLITGLNKDTNTSLIKASKVAIDLTGQSLEVSFNSLKSNVDNKETRNLFIESNSEKGYYSSSNNFVESENYITSDYIEVNVGEIYTLCKFSSEGYHRLVVFDKDKISIGDRILVNSSRIEYLVPSGIKYIRVSIEKNLKYKIEKGENTNPIWSPAPEDVIDKLEANATSISVIQGNIETLIKDTTIEQEGSSIKLKDAYSSLKQTVSGLSLTVGNHTTDIQTAQTVADSKAKVFTSTPTTPYKLGDLWVQGSSGDMMRCRISRSTGSYVASDWEKASKYTDDTKANEVGGTVSGLLERVTTVEGNYSTFSQNYEGFKLNVTNNYSTKTELVSAISDIQVGGRNLLRNSNFKNGLEYWNYGTESTVIEDTTFGKVVKVTSSILSKGINQKATKELELNKEYTLSCYVKSNVNTKVALALNGSGTNSATLIEVSTSWTLVKETFKNNGSNVTPRIYTGENKSVELYIANVKFEEGNKATDWTPSIEEVDSSIISLENRIKTAELKITDESIIATVSQTITKAKNDAISSANGTTDTKLQNYSTTTQMKTYVGQELDNITLSISNNYSTKTETSSLKNQLEQSKQNIRCNDLGAKINYSAFATTNTGEIYLHGFDSNNNPTDTNGKIYWNDEAITIPKGMINPNNDCGIGNDIYLFLNVTNPSVIMGCWYNSSNKTWMYKRFIGASDSGGFTPSNDHIAIGILNMKDAESFNYAYLFETPQALKGLTLGSMDLFERINNAELKLTDSSIVSIVTSSSSWSSVSGTANSALSTAQGAQSSANNANSKIDNLKVGGRNLLIRNFETKDTYINTNGSIATANGFATSDYIEVSSGEILAFSKQNSTTDGYFRWAWYKSDKTYISRTPNNNNSFLWEVPKDAGFVRISYPMDSYPKVERGNKITDWTPAPEDIDSSISSVESRVNTVEQSITATAITTTISSSINNGTTSISTTQFVMDKNGFTVKNGAITIQNKAGTSVLTGDTNGNLTMTGILITKGGNNKAVELNGPNMYLYDWEGTTRTNPVGTIFTGRRIVNGSTTSLTGNIIANCSNAYLSLSYQNGTGYSDYMLFDNDGIAGKGSSFPIWVQRNIIANCVLGIRNASKGTYNSIWNSDNNVLVMEVSTAKAGEGFQIQSTSGSVLMGIRAGNSYPITLNTSTQVGGNFTVKGSKNSLQETKNYGQRLINAYETAEYYFGDIGSGSIRNGECLIWIDDIFKECINTDIEYHVFTQAYKGDIRKIERHKNYFVVYGEENTEFSWEVKAKRKGYENIRLDSPDIGTVEEYAVFDDEDLKAKTTEDTLLDILTFDLENLLMEG